MLNRTVLDSGSVLIHRQPLRPGDHVQVPAGARKNDRDLRDRGEPKGEWWKLSKPDMLAAAAACHETGRPLIAARIQEQLL